MARTRRKAATTALEWSAGKYASLAGRVARELSRNRLGINPGRIC